MMMMMMMMMATLHYVACSSTFSSIILLFLVNITMYLLNSFNIDLLLQMIATSSCLGRKGKARISSSSVVARRKLRTVINIIFGNGVLTTLVVYAQPRFIVTSTLATIRREGGFFKSQACTRKRGILSQPIMQLLGDSQSTRNNRILPVR